MDEKHDVVDALVTFGRQVADAGLLMSSCGNASLRVGEHHMAISASGSNLDALGPEHIAFIDLRDGAYDETGPRPSMESELHRFAYAARPGVGAVLHCQSRSATLLACHADPPTNLDFFPEIPAYVRAHAYVPYAQPGSPMLAESVRRALDDAEVTVVQMRNHGQVVVGAEAGKVIRRARFFEQACWMALQPHPLTTISAPMAADLRGYSRDC